MFKLICLVAFCAVASAQWWPQQTDAPSWQQPSVPNWPNRPQPIEPPRPPMVDEIPNFPWQQPQQPPQWPNWQQPQQPIAPPRPPILEDSRPNRPNFPNWNQPPQQPSWPAPPQINDEVGRPGVRDSRCPAINGRNVLIFAHERECNMFYICNNGMRYTFECPSGLMFDRQLNTCNRAANVRC